VDIDETMFQVAKNELGVKTNDLLLDKNDKLLEELIEKNIKYDLVFIDVY
jgi:predicted O-methyltransferase YrrM